MIFFFSSRRRHTRFDCDWSSDVCSSDLAAREHRNARVASLSESCQIARRAMASCRRFAVACAGPSKPTVEAGVLRRQALGWLGGGVLGGMALAGGSLRAASLPRLQLADDAAA